MYVCDIDIYVHVLICDIFIVVLSIYSVLYWKFMVAVGFIIYYLINRVNFTWIYIYIYMRTDIGITLYVLDMSLYVHTPAYACMYLFWPYAIVKWDFKRIANLESLHTTCSSDFIDLFCAVLYRYFVSYLHTYMFLSLLCTCQKWQNKDVQSTIWYILGSVLQHDVISMFSYTTGPWIWQWIKSISNELDIAFRMHMSQLLRHVMHLRLH